MVSNENNEFGLSCPNCGAPYAYSAEAIASEGFMDCQNCGKRLHTRDNDERMEPSITPSPFEKQSYHYTEAPKKRSNAGLWCVIVMIFLFVPVIIAIPAIICILYFKREQLFGGGKSSGPKKPKTPDTW